MIMSMTEYTMQAKIVKETIQILTDKIINVRKLLEVNPHDAKLRRELRELTLDMTITLNELEQTEKALKAHGTKADHQQLSYS